MFLHKKGIKHNDVKIKNYLVSGSDENPFVELGDFGLSGHRSGGTPFFASPECITGSVLAKSDIFSLGRAFLYILCEDPELFKQIVAIPITDEAKLVDLRNNIQAYAIFKLIFDMTHIDYNYRPNPEDVLKRLGNMKMNDLSILKWQDWTKHLIDQQTFPDLS